jgi:hypothetical protein
MRPGTLTLWIAAAVSLWLPISSYAADDIIGPAPPEAPEVVARDAEGRVTLRATRLVEPLVLDGELTEPVYTEVRAAGGFVQQEPHEGEPATEKTDAWIFFDDANLYVAARLWDSSPDRIVANELRRDNFNITQGASFAVAIDTFYDRRNGFYFQTNPLGALRDGLVTDESEMNIDWNTVWNTRAARFEGGWSVEMVIPFKSLRYKQGQGQIWGLNLMREVRWKNEVTYLSPVPASWSWRGIRKFSSAATLVDVATPPTSLNLEVKPYGIAGVKTNKQASPPVSNDASADAGFDVKYGITKSLTADFTLNTDFAQVEVDEQQINLTRFSLFFPEKREFFLEGRGIFTFGGESGAGFTHGFPTSTPIVFFSRRIGLLGGEALPIRAGGRVTGRMGKYTVGALSIQTGDMESVGAVSTNFSVLRLRRDVLRRSNIGVIGTYRSANTAGTGTNQVFGVDGNFAFFQNLMINAYFAASRTPVTSGNDNSYMVKVSNQGDRYGIEYQHLMVGDNFRPEVGFIRRLDFRRNNARLRFSPRPASIESIRKFSFETTIDYFHNLEGVLETREVGGKFGIEFENSDSWDINFISNFEFLPYPFHIAPGIVIPIGPYDFNQIRTTYELGPQRRVSGRVSASYGGFYSGERTEVSYSGRVEVTPQFSIEPFVSLNWIDLVEGEFTTELFRVRGTYTLTARMFVSALVQYNSSTSSVSTNARFRWEYEPGSDLFVVYTDGRDTRLGGFPGLQNRGLVVKFTKLFRL